METKNRRNNERKQTNWKENNKNKSNGERTTNTEKQKRDKNNFHHTALYIRTWAATMASCPILETPVQTSAFFFP